MSRRSEIHEAETEARAQRMRLAALLRLDDSRPMSAEELHLAKTFLDVSKIDPARYEKGLSTEAVNALFARGILSFGGRNG